MDCIHSSTAGGHSGIQATYMRAKSTFFWPAMKKEILQFVSACDVCQRNKGDHNFPAGLLQPLPIPDHAWQHISMDFIEGLPMSERKEVILVPKKWHHWLPLTEWWYNTNYHTSLKVSPFTTLYGYNPPHLAFHSTSTAYVAAVEEYLKQRAAMLDLLKDSLHKSQERMKLYADKTRVDRSFVVGDRKIGSVAYKLLLPAEARIHHVFHISQLKKQIGAQHIISPTLPVINSEGQVLVIPAAALDSRVIVKNGIPVPQLLIQ
ncbi:uncharacterized protein LOC113324570 [Papaver somniferum]|uniref:uncharacterized protein LOC113324570 n=1 Tax=Papaver somniferum TaxID=3469 RepID=UPI000E6FDFC8|nr:uncharacterized protein LOC113324570 [Papaver somniferum]